MRREPTSRLVAATLGRRRGPLEPPPALLFALELPRALVEFGAFCAAAPALQLAPRGDGHAVLVLPGFTATDSSTAALRTYLRTLGYDAAGWGLGRNLGPTREALREMDGLVTRLTERHGGAVSIVGCSLGGVYARELARRRPRDVRLVVTLGSPYQLASPRQSRTSALYDRYTHLHVPADELPRAGRPARALPVPATSIFTRTDGVVAPATCTEPPTERAETIEVQGSHSGLGHHPAAVYAIADRLAQPTGTWSPFVPPRVLRRLYPEPPDGHLRAAS